MVEVMTDKATVEIGSPRVGRVAKRMFAEGERCPVGKVLIVIDVEGRRRAGGQASAHGGAEPAEEPRRSRRPPAVPDRQRRRRRAGGPGHARDAQAGARHRRRHPRGRGVRPGWPGHLRRRTGAWGGAARRSRAASAPRADGVRIPFRGMRRKIAETLVRSKHTAPHVTYVEEIDCTELVALRAKLNARPGALEKLSFLPFIIKATIAALKKYPQMNAMLDDAARRDHPVAELPHRPRHRDGERPHRAGDPRRRPQVARRARARHRAAGRGDPHRQGDPRRARRLDLHHHQPGRARRRDGDGDHQPARGRHPGRAPDLEAARRSWATKSSSATS